MAITERISTGGKKEFVYTEEDLERIAHTDTDSTREFKEALTKWQEEKRIKREKRNNLKHILLFIFSIVAAIGFIIFLILFFMKKI